MVSPLYIHMGDTTTWRQDSGQKLSWAILIRGENATENVLAIKICCAQYFEITSAKSVLFCPADFTQGVKQTI